MKLFWKCTDLAVGGSNLTANCISVIIIFAVLIRMIFRLIGFVHSPISKVCGFQTEKCCFTCLSFKRCDVKKHYDY